jgi:hypothetical protein
VRLVVESEPPGADVFRVADGLRVGTTPWATEVSRGQAQAVYRLRLDGYREQTVTLEASADRTAHVLLAQDKKAKRPKQPGRGATAAKTRTEPSPSDSADKADYPTTTDLQRMDLKNPFE